MSPYIHLYEWVNVPPSFSNSMHICVMANACVHRFSNKRFFEVNIMNSYHCRFASTATTIIIIIIRKSEPITHNYTPLPLCCSKWQKNNNQQRWYFLIFVENSCLLLSPHFLCVVLWFRAQEPSLKKKKKNQHMIYGEIVNNIKRERAKRLWFRHWLVPIWQHTIENSNLYFIYCWC